MPLGAAVIKVGLVGAGPAMGSPAIEALLRQRRLCPTELFDPCLKTGDADAKRLMMSPSSSLTGVLKRSTGIVAAEVKWMGVEPLVMATSWQRSVLVLAGVLSRLNLPEVHRLRNFAALTRTLVMPELIHRWARSTLRLRELTATQLGAIERMELTCRLPADARHPRLMALDWCCNVMQSEPRSILSSPDGHQLTLRFRRLSKDGEPVSAQIRIEEGTDERFPIAQGEITCRHGRVRISGEQSLEWQTDRQPLHTESLTADRSAEDVMIDLFGRRLAGGLVPVPDIGDLARAHELLLAAQRSSTTGAECPIVPPEEDVQT